MLCKPDGNNEHTDCLLHSAWKRGNFGKCVCKLLGKARRNQMFALAKFRSESKGLILKPPLAMSQLSVKAMKRLLLHTYMFPCASQLPSMRFSYYPLPPKLNLSLNLAAHANLTIYLSAVCVYLLHSFPISLLLKKAFQACINEKCNGFQSISYKAEALLQHVWVGANAWLLSKTLHPCKCEHAAQRQSCSKRGSQMLKNLPLQAQPLRLLTLRQTKIFSSPTTAQTDTWPCCTEPMPRQASSPFCCPSAPYCQRRVGIHSSHLCDSRWSAWLGQGWNWAHCRSHFSAHRLSSVGTVDSLVACTLSEGLSVHNHASLWPSARNSSPAENSKL